MSGKIVNPVPVYERRAFTFRSIVIEYDFSITHEVHRICVAHGKVEAEGPWLSWTQPVISYEWSGRFFIAQRLTDNMPDVFEMIPSKETVCETRLPEKT